MEDRSHLDAKYFIDPYVYNCPFCKRGNVYFAIDHPVREFDWSNNKKCIVIFVECKSCKKTSMHLTFDRILTIDNGRFRFADDIDIDSKMFYSAPTSFFVIDSRIPNVLRELITEAEGCVKMNFLTGASACTRKAIYEFTILQKCQGENYDERIKELKSKFPQIDQELFDVLGHIKDLTSDKVHEQSWDKWDSNHLILFIETLKVILNEVYVIPDQRQKKSRFIQGLIPAVKAKSNKKQVEE
jgi:hypothetical protein